MSFSSGNLIDEIERSAWYTVRLDGFVDLRYTLCSPEYTAQVSVRAMRLSFEQLVIDAMKCVVYHRLGIPEINRKKNISWYRQNVEFVSIVLLLFFFSFLFFSVLFTFYLYFILFIYLFFLWQNFIILSKIIYYGVLLCSSCIVFKMFIFLYTYFISCVQYFWDFILDLQ